MLGSNFMVKQLLLFCGFIICFYFGMFETAIIYGFYNNETYTLVHNILFQAATLLLGGLILSRMPLSMRRFLGLGLLALIPLFALVNLSSNPVELENFELGEDTIHVVTFGAHATTLPNLYIDKVERCYGLFSCVEVLFKENDFKSYSYTKDDACFQFKVTNVKNKSKELNYCAVETPAQ